MTHDIISSGWLIIGSSDDPRVVGFQSALNGIGCDAQTLDYLADWEQTLPEQLTPETCLRIESPGHDLDAIQRLMSNGCEPARLAGFQVVDEAQFGKSYLEQGAFIAPHQLYFGLQHYLRGLEQHLVNYPVAWTMNHIDDILLFYDKQQCHQRLTGQQLPTPPAMYDIGGFEQLMSAMDDNGLKRVFIKPRYGSGASGILALDRRPHLLSALTTIEVANDSWFNTRKLRHLRGHETIAPIIDRLAGWGLHCERWMPKLRIGPFETDCRFLIVDGHVDFAVLRKSRSPITNLHLLNQRADISEVRSLLSQDVWNQIEITLSGIARMFPKSFHLAVDLAIHANRRDHFVLEINAFGDFLQNVFHQGMNSYQWQLDRFRARTPWR
ncbi:MAG: STM4014 family protein [Candidatus Thiodiazotropha sp.]